MCREGYPRAMEPAGVIVDRVAPLIQKQTQSATQPEPTSLSNECAIAAALPRRFHDARLMGLLGRDSGPRVNLATLRVADGLFIHGDAGRGKTHLAAAMTREAIEGGKRAKFVRASDFY